MSTHYRRYNAYIIIITLVITTFTATATLYAEDNDTNRTWMFDPLSKRYVNRMLDWTAGAVARRYNLNTNQDRIARQMLQDNAWEFIQSHKDDLQDVVGTMFSARVEQKDPGARAVQQWAARVYPLFDEAREMILSENERFAKLLNPEQREIHQRDIDRTKLQFEEIDKRLKRWKSGQYRPGEFIRGPFTTQYDQETPRDKQQQQQTDGPAVGGGTDGQDEDKATTKPAMHPLSDDYWRTYVELFIGVFELDEGQRNAAYAVLQDSRERAEAYRTSSREDMRQAENALRQAQEEDDEARITLAQERLNKFQEPLMKIFDDMRWRLMDIPTLAQYEISRKFFDQLSPDLALQMDQRYAAATQAATTQPTTRYATTQPADSGTSEAGATGSDDKTTAEAVTTQPVKIRRR